jgi:hypothetical protein
VATTRLRLLYLAARITRHGGQTEIHFGSQYQERHRFDQLMVRLRLIERNGEHAASRIEFYARRTYPAQTRAERRTIQGQNTSQNTAFHPPLRGFRTREAAAIPAVHNSGGHECLPSGH